MERENVLKLFHNEKPDWVPEASQCMLIPSVQLDDLERPHRCDGVDWFGVRWLSQSELGGVITHPSTDSPYILEDISKWESVIKFPDLNKVDWTSIREEILNDVAKKPDKLVYAMLEHGMFERLTLLMGFENALVALIDDPDSCKAYANAYADFKIKLIDRILESYPFDMFLYQDDLGSGHGPLISPQLFREIFKDATCRIGKHIQSRGVIWGFHSCGCVEPFLDDLVDMGIQLLNPVQTCNDQNAIKQKYGEKLVLFGGLNNQEITDIPTPNEDDLRDELRRAVNTLAPGGGFILQIRQVPVSVNGVSAVDILNEEYNKYGRSFYSESCTTK